MKKMQFITCAENEFNNYKSQFEVSNFNDLKALDNFDINILDLSSKELWESNVNSIRPSNITKETSNFKSVKQMIINSKKTNVVICLPRNVYYYWECINERRCCQLKDMIDIFIKIINDVVPLNALEIEYENNSTKVGNENLDSSFYFKERFYEAITRANNSEKITTIKNNNIIVTTIDIVNKESYEKILEFLTIIGLKEKEKLYPEWLYEYEFMDDVQQKEIIDNAKREIDLQIKKIEEAREKIQDNMHYKSILVAQSDELVCVVFEILEEIFGITLNEFKDQKKEDFLFKKDEITYIGEIKGVTSNVRYENISQVDIHCSHYMDILQDENREEKIKKILIMNYERNKNVAQRNAINQMQIDLAQKNEVLIIDTKTLLDIYEKILKNKITKENVVKYISITSGIVEIDKI